MTDPGITQPPAGVLVGPWPPPVHGQALATEALHQELVRRGILLTALDTSEGTGTGWRLAVRKVRRNLSAALHILSLGSKRVVYISTNTGRGMWFTVLVTMAARLRRSRILVHHHSYDYITNHRLHAQALARAAGEHAVHIVLGDEMGKSLRRRLHGVGHTLTLNNAGLIDDRLLSVNLTRTRVVLGHMSNLSATKGVREAVDLAIAARQSGLDLHLVIAGPMTDLTAKDAIDRAQESLGDAFEYRGLLNADAKLKFYSDISHFAFATSYRNEAAPLVLLEALAAGVPCLARPRGLIEEQLGVDGGYCVPAADDFVEGGLRWLSRVTVYDTGHAEKARKRFAELAAAYDSQVAQLVRLISHGEIATSLMQLVHDSPGKPHGDPASGVGG